MPPISRAALLILAAALAAGPASAASIKIKNCSDRTLTVQLKDSDAGPPVAEGSLPGLHSIWEGNCNAAQCVVSVSMGGVGGSTTTAGSACAQPLTMGGAVVSVFPVPASLCTCGAP